MAHVSKKISLCSKIKNMVSKITGCKEVKHILYSKVEFKTTKLIFHYLFRTFLTL